MWWAGPPAIAKGYMDRIFSSGFAYSFGPDGHQRLLADKQVATIVTIGDSEKAGGESLIRVRHRWWRRLLAAPFRAVNAIVSKLPNAVASAVCTVSRSMSRLR